MRDTIFRHIVVLFEINKYVATTRYIAREKKKKSWDYGICLRVCVIDCPRWITFRTQLCVLSSLSKEFTRLRKREIEKRIRDAAGVVTFREISRGWLNAEVKRDCFSRANSMKSEKYDFHIENVLLYRGIGGSNIRWINTDSKVCDRQKYGLG